MWTTPRLRPPWPRDQSNLRRCPARRYRTMRSQPRLRSIGWARTPKSVADGGDSCGAPGAVVGWCAVVVVAPSFVGWYAGQSPARDGDETRLGLKCILRTKNERRDENGADRDCNSYFIPSVRTNFGHGNNCRVEVDSAKLSSLSMTRIRSKNEKIQRRAKNK